MSIFEKKKKLVHMSLQKPLFSYHYFEEIIDFVNGFWERRKIFSPGYYFIHPILKRVKNGDMII